MVALRCTFFPRISFKDSDTVAYRRRTFPATGNAVTARRDAGDRRSSNTLRKSMRALVSRIAIVG